MRSVERVKAGIVTDCMLIGLVVLLRRHFVIAIVDTINSGFYRFNGLTPASGRLQGVITCFALGNIEATVIIAHPSMRMGCLTIGGFEWALI